ncbi:hypothetical protein [Skermanella stibiiresistens]|uniref:hypothetical protein n=1 Tax=Skermanella stibiiresistens TaxID=913326 RepID=UPI0004BB7188|nr:hypothetical protein [Skermanella stibiiresistens]
MPPVLGIVIPTLDAASLNRTLDRIGPIALAEGWPILISDGGSTDRPAERPGVRVILASRGRGQQLAAGAEALLGGGVEWLFFLHADSLPSAGWREAIAGFIAEPRNEGRAGYGRLALDDTAPAARRIEALVAWRCRWLGLPYGDQGLLIHRDLYREVGGFPAVPLMEDVTIVRSVGRDRLAQLPFTMTTSAERYRRGGYIRRPLRNLGCLVLHLAGVPSDRIRRLYG